jgi:hypothetical protein
MSEHVQSCSQGPVRTEIFASTDKQQKWAIALLDAIARYPMQHGTCFGEYETVEVVQPIDAAHSPLTAVLLAPAGPGEQAAIGTIDAVLPEGIQVYQVVGIHKDECSLAIERGGRELHDRLMNRCCALSLDKERRSVV